MAAPFLITGLPRSRTAWMATAATDGWSVCYHEPTMRLARWDDVFPMIWHGRGVFDFVGISDHGLGFHLPEIIRRASPRVLIIERPIAEVNASLAALNLGTSNVCDLLLEALAYDHPLIRRVPYAALADTARVVDALRHLMPGAPIDPFYIAGLQARNIQADIAITMEHAAARAGDLSTLLPADVLARLVPR